MFHVQWRNGLGKIGKTGLWCEQLNDVNMACNLNINTGDFLSFADYFFDGFVVDWVVQDRINNAKRQVEEAIRRTESIVNQLQRM